jgi:hypothetical protein
MSRCQRCQDQGFLRAPCPDCGAIKVREHAVEVVAYMAGKLFDISPFPKEKRRRRDR